MSVILSTPACLFFPLIAGMLLVLLFHASKRWFCFQANKSQVLVLVIQLQLAFKSCTTLTHWPKPDEPAGAETSCQSCSCTCQVPRAVACKSCATPLTQWPKADKPAKAKSCCESYSCSCHLNPVQHLLRSPKLMLPTVLLLYILLTSARLLGLGQMFIQTHMDHS